MTTTVAWPDHLDFDGKTFVKVEDPLLNVLQKGDTIFGWEGDPCIHMYFQPQNRQWILFRYAEGHYHLVRRLPFELCSAADLAANTVAWLVTHDAWRGHNPLLIVEQANAKARKENDERIHEKWNDALPKAREAFKKIARDDLAEHPMFQGGGKL